MAATGPRGKYATGIERRERIIDRATERFMETGYATTSLADIAKDVGITTPGLMHHFPTKQHLLLAVAERRFDESARVAFESPTDTDGTGTLRLMYRLRQLFTTQPGLMELFVHMGGEAADRTSAAHELFVARYDRVIADLTQRFQEGVDAGTLRPDRDYEAIARECIAVSDGLQLQWVLSGGTLDFAGLARAHLERLSAEILVSGEHVDLTVDPPPPAS
ncbi:TetR/AcrR family transcriptional regulator [Agromyces mangrovi Wang et al. 2018]|uniref:TetR/AcrR family transcriptional regulator n=1 Tax=Agromyces mangrovi TaxID=1858653 RepID=UPI0025725C35|nr:TetR/AcrR family transcriptional regulator [Agromyces mangrovi]BDZ65401.1 TetR family transcriptional regulator [Agromyces mangrovi]